MITPDSRVSSAQGPLVAVDDPRLRDPAWLGRVFWAGVALVLAVPALVATEFKPWVFFQPDNLKVTVRFLGDFFPPALAPDFLAMVLLEAWRTIAIATAGLVLALALAIPLTLAATHVLSVSALKGRMNRMPFVLRQLI